MGFGLKVTKGLVTAVARIGSRETAAHNIGWICRTIDFQNYRTQNELAQHSVKTLLQIRHPTAIETLTALATNDITYAESSVEEIKRIGSNDYAATLAAIGVSFSSLRESAWDLMVDLRGPHLADAAQWVSLRGNAYHVPILQKLLCAGSWGAIEAARDVFYLRPETSIPFVRDVLAGKIKTNAVRPETLREFFEEISNPALLRPFITKAYQRAYPHAPAQQHGTLDKLRDLFRAADRSGVLGGGINLSHVLRAVVVQAEEQFAPEILHYTMHNPAL